MPFDPRTEYHRYRRYFVDLKNLYQKKEVVVYTSLILSFFTVAFFGIFALKPTLVTIASLINELKSKRQIDHTLQTKINALSVAQTNLMAVEKSLILLDEAFPKDPSLSQLLYQLEFLIQKNNLTVRTLNLDSVIIMGSKTEKKTEGGVEGPKEIGFSLSVSGGFEDLNTFASDLEKLRRIVFIDSSGFSQTKNEKSEQVLSLNISGKVHFLPEK